MTGSGEAESWFGQGEDRPGVRCSQSAGPSCRPRDIALWKDLVPLSLRSGVSEQGLTLHHTVKPE